MLELVFHFLQLSFGLDTERSPGELIPGVGPWGEALAAVVYTQLQGDSGGLRGTERVD